MAKSEQARAYALHEPEFGGCTAWVDYGEGEVCLMRELGGPRVFKTPEAAQPRQRGGDGPDGGGTGGGVPEAPAQARAPTRAQEQPVEPPAPRVLGQRGVGEALTKGGVLRPTHRGFVQPAAGGAGLLLPGCDC